MSDRPNTNSEAASERAPNVTGGGWRVLEARSTAASPNEESAATRSASEAGWRVVADRPQTGEPRVPDERPTGLWRAPSTTGGTSQVWRTPEGTALATAEAEPAEAVEEAVEAVEEAVEAETPEEAVLPFDEVVEEGRVDELEGLEEATEDAELDAEEEDETPDTMGMSELVALASLVDQPAAPAQEAEGEATPEAASDDPAEYARQQLERLRAGQVDGGESVAILAVPSDEEVAPVVETAPDPAAVAREQLARLGIAPTPAPVELTPQEQALLERFRATEAQARALRDQYRAKEISRDELTQQLRGIMVLDDNQSYWMVGTESDQWYHYVDNTWVKETPPVLEKVAQGEPAEAIEEDDDTGALDETMATSPLAGEEEMPLPRRVPRVDPDMTLVGTQGINLDPSLQPTIPMATITSDAAGATIINPAVSEATIANPAISDGEVIASPIPAAVPSYTPEPSSPLYEEVARDQRNTTLRTIGIAAAVLVGIFLLLGACGILATVVTYNNIVSPYQEQITALANYQPNFQTSRIYAADNSVIAELIGGGGDRQPIPLAQMSPYLIHAVISAEDQRFYDNPGWDPIAIVRAFLTNLSAGQVEEGASTITQQVVSNLILGNAPATTANKLTEVVLASEIARQYDKNFILELYLNEIFFGNNAYGVQAASEFYFNHDALDLNIPESALLTALIRLPTTYDPVVNRTLAFEQMNNVLADMVSVGCLQFQHAPYLGEPVCITDALLREPQTVIDKARVEAADYEPRSAEVRYAHFVNFVQAQVEQIYGTTEAYQRGFQIYTTLVPRLQDAAQTALTASLQGVNGRGVNTGAVLVSDPRDGSIRVMIGSPDFNNAEIDGQVNNVFTWQQPGSSVKPVVYTAALEGVDANGAFQYMTPASILWDVPTTFPTTPPYAPVNFDGEFHGAIPLRFALQNSYNVPAVKAYAFVGNDRFIDTSQRMGLRFLDDAQFGLASALGATEVRLYDHVQAYGTLANNGVRVPLFAITRITDAQGNEVALPPRAQSSQTVQPEIAFLMQNILSDNDARAAEFGTNSGLFLPEYPGLVAAKTGTTDGNRDLWTMGFTHNAVVGVWMGSLNNTPTNTDTSLTSIPVWNAVMRAALQGTRPDSFNPPAGIVQAQVCTSTGALYDPSVTQNCPSVRTELFVQSEPPQSANQGLVATIPIDSWSGLVANEFCQSNVVNQRFVNIADTSALQWLAGAGAGFAASIGLPNPPVSAPTQACSINTQNPQIGVTAPAEGASVQDTVQITGSASGINFNRYQLELAPANTDAFSLLVGPSGTPITNGTLGQWDTRNTPNGQYRLRVSMFGSNGGFASRTVNVTVNNPLPTATPTLIPTQTPFPTQPILQFTPQIILPTQAFATVLPFDQTNNNFSSQGGVTPTATIILGG